jgi:antiphage defense system Thoeris ThsB-like protein
LREQLEGVRAALRNRRTPPQLKEGLRKRAVELERQLRNSPLTCRPFGENRMADKRAFISFDFDHDEDLRNLLAGQAKHPDTPFDMQDWSVKEPMTGDWKEKVRARIRRADLTIIICGQYTNLAAGVATELSIARSEGKPYFLLWGRADKTCTKPSSAYDTDKMYNWTWDNLKALIGGQR